MALDKLALVFKVGDKVTAPGQEVFGIKDGMPVCYIDEQEWGMPLDKILSKDMHRIFANVIVPRSMKSEMANMLRETDSNPQKHIERQKRMAFVDLQAASGIKDLETKLRSHSEMVPTIDGSGFNWSELLKSSGPQMSREAVEDPNQITQGYASVGAGGTYANWVAAFADTGNLTGNLSLEQINTVIEVARATDNITLGGFTLNLYGQNHLGSPVAGVYTQFNHNNHGFDLRFEGAGIVNMYWFHMQRVAAAINASGVITQVTVNQYTFNLYDNLYDEDTNGGNGFRIEVATPLYRWWNNVVWDVSLHAHRNSNAGGNAIFENCVAYNSGVGFELNAQAGTLRSCAGFDNTTDYSTIMNAMGNNNADSDGTAANGNWGFGNNNLINQVAANCFTSVVDGQANFMDILRGGPLVNAGQASAIAGNIAGIRGRARPNYQGGICIGAAEIARPSRPQKSTIGIGIGIGIGI